ncbi:MAG: rhodanese-like domain-containing protein [Betaproteobacteria bacterium]|nr:rhodanese-like domain-containing protein [Betaproteobacteria bacterium]
MGRLSEILALARSRGEQLKLPYAGALTPGEAWEVLQLAPGAKMLDIRTRAELDYVGRIPGIVEIEWHAYGMRTLNPHFLQQLRQQVDPESLVMFICRSGRRSHAAAAFATQSGYCECYNVLEGFQGDKDANAHRDTVGGWRRAGLPWYQS